VGPRVSPANSSSERNTAAAVTRRGEALGLRWSDLDLDAGRASIRQTVIAVKHTPMLGTPKTAKGRRTVTLDAATVAGRREHRNGKQPSGY
jgi:integrase